MSGRHNLRVKETHTGNFRSNGVLPSLVVWIVQDLFIGGKCNNRSRDFLPDDSREFFDGVQPFAVRILSDGLIEWSSNAPEVGINEVDTEVLSLYHNKTRSSESITRFLP